MQLLKLRKREIMQELDRKLNQEITRLGFNFYNPNHKIVFAIFTDYLDYMDRQELPLDQMSEEEEVSNEKMICRIYGLEPFPKSSTTWILSFSDASETLESFEKLKVGASFDDVCSLIQLSI